VGGKGSKFFGNLLMPGITSEEEKEMESRAPLFRAARSRQRTVSYEAQLTLAERYGLRLPMELERLTPVQREDVVRVSRLPGSGFLL
jgi:hypothetical protein